MMSLPDEQGNDAAPNDQQPLTLQVQQRHDDPCNKRSGPRRARDRRQRSATFAAVVGLGLASWIMTNVTYVELGVFLRELPEHYSIYAYSILALESANVYPILYMLFNARQQLVGQAVVIWWLLSQGVVVAGLMSLFWGQTAQVFGSSHSLAMLVLTHLGGMVSTTSSVVLYPYVAGFPPLFTTALATGEGLSGSLAALLGVVQDPGDAMRFSVTTFYLFCAVIMSMSLAAFAFLECHPWPRAIRATQEAENESVDVLKSKTKQQYALDDASRDQREAEEDTLLTRSACGSCPASASTSASASPTASQGHETSQAATFRQVWPLLGCQWALASLSFGLLPSTMPYVYKKFAPTEDAESVTAQFQTTASIAALILGPIACLLTSWWRLYYVRSLSFILVMMALLLLSFSITSKPMLSGEKHGYFLPLLVHVFYLTGCAYTQTMLYLTLKRFSEQQQSTSFARRVYQWNGLATQLGAMSGTAIAFPLVFWREDLFTQ